VRDGRETVLVADLVALRVPMRVGVPVSADVRVAVGRRVAVLDDARDCVRVAVCVGALDRDGVCLLPDGEGDALNAAVCVADATSVADCDRARWVRLPVRVTVEVMLSAPVKAAQRMPKVFPAQMGELRATQRPTRTSVRSWH
jgi:hypothetical protein